MANVKVHDAALKGFYGPFFPSKLSRIQKRYAYESVRWNHQFFDQVADRLHTGKVSLHPRTSDGYTWIAAVSFMLAGVRYKVLFPMAHDTRRLKDGTNADRHVALYTSHEVADSRLAYAAEMFADDLVATYRYVYEKAISDGKQKATKSA